MEKFTARLLAGATGAPRPLRRRPRTWAARWTRRSPRAPRCTPRASGAAAYFPAGVLTGLTTDHAAARQELFGPVAMVFPAADEDDALRIANDTPYGLGSYLFTTDPAQAERVADRIEAGMVFVNGVGAEGAELPFGGIKRSGFGRELGRPGTEEFVNKKLIRTVSQ
ncbi:NAD-dependent succinate-semialdehyde dehydrogenase [Streptomyces hirsutus]